LTGVESLANLTVCQAVQKPGALASGCGLFAPAPANVPVVVPFPPKVSE